MPPSTTSTFVTFSVTDRFPSRAITLATAYAETFVTASNQQAVAGIPHKIAQLDAQIKSLNTQIARGGAISRPLPGSSPSLMPSSS